MSEQRNDGGPAFPELDREWDDDLRAYRYGSAGGLALRDYFAAKAMPRLLELEITQVWNQGMGLEGERDNALCVARAAYRMADAMLRARDA